MKIQVTLAGDTPAEVSKLASELAALLGGKSAAPAAAAGATGGDAAAKAKAAADAKAKADAAKKAADAKAKADAAVAAASASTGSGEVTINSLRDLGRACIKAGKNAEMKAALTDLGADSITTLDAAKYAEADVALRAIVNPPAGEPGEDAL